MAAVLAARGNRGEHRIRAARATPERLRAAAAEGLAAETAAATSTSTPSASSCREGSAGTERRGRRGPPATKGGPQSASRWARTSGPAWPTSRTGQGPWVTPGCGAARLAAPSSAACTTDQVPGTARRSPSTSSSCDSRTPGLAAGVDVAATAAAGAHRRSSDGGLHASGTVAARHRPRGRAGQSSRPRRPARRPDEDVHAVGPGRPRRSAPVSQTKVCDTG